MSRRAFLSRAALATVAAPTLAEILAACGSSEPEGISRAGFQIASPDNPVTWPIHKDNQPIEDGLEPEQNATLRLYNYSDYIGPAVVKAFEKKYAEYNVSVRVSTFNDTDEALTKIRAGKVPYDIYFPSYDQIAKMVTAKLIRPLNHSYITNIKNVWPQFSNPWYDGGWRYTVPYTTYTTGVGWRNDKISEPIGDMDNPYDALWNAEFSGQVAVIDDWHTMMAMVLLRNGVTDINTNKPKDLRLMQSQMLDMASKTKPKVNITMYNDLPAGQVSLAQMWSGDVINAQYYLPKDETPEVLSYWFPQDGKGAVDNDLMVILAGGESPVTAHLFIQHMLDAKNALANFGYIGYQPPQNSLDVDKVVEEGYVPANLGTAVVRPEWFDTGYRLLELRPANDAAWHEIWQRFKAGA
ncbi:MAG: polyamine ABC transporter substrate-binding protein [Actinomycetes bacterium]